MRAACKFIKSALLRNQTLGTFKHNAVKSKTSPRVSRAVLSYAASACFIQCTFHAALFLLCFRFEDLDVALGADKLLDFWGGEPQPTAAAP